MKKVGCREFKNRMGRYLKLVGRGESLLITDRGKVVAQLGPAELRQDGPLSTMDVLRKLEAEGHLRLGARPFRKIKPVPTRGKPASQMVIEDRE